MTASSLDDGASLRRENERLAQELSQAKGELAEARDQQRATTEILSVISRSPTDAKPVFDTIAASATRLCDGLYSVVFRFDGEMITMAADSAESPRASAIIRSAYPAPPGRGTMVSRALLERRVIVLTDAQDSVANPAGAERARAIGYRAGLSVPMLRGDTAIGAINVVRREAIPFTDTQVDLLKTFADQAVIAIENTGLFEAEQASKRELQESLEYQTATSEVLIVISRSPSQLQPVFDFIARSASRLCGDEHAIVTRYDGRLLHLAAQYNPRPGIADEQASFYPREPHDATSISGRAFVRAALVHIPDVETEQWEPSAREGYRRMGLRAAIAVPMMHNDRPIGVIGVSRGTPGSFSDRQIQLLQTFADQAVIAIENTRLFEAEQASKRELSEALDQQTATTEVLSVISRSPGELQPVFEAMLSNAVRICDAKFGVLFGHEDGTFHPAAWVGVPEVYEESLRQRASFRPDAGAPLDRLLKTKELVHTADQLAEGSPSPAAKLGGARSLIAVPMFKDSGLVGAIVIYRTEVRPFTDKQIDLLKSFAAQAVIAIENTRLLNELRDSLQQQTATADVLKVISRSALELQSVLSALVSSASHLCDAPMVAIHVERDGSLPGRARHGFSTEVVEALSKIGQVWGRGSLAGRTISEGKPVHIPEVEADAEYTFNDFTRITGARSMLGVPLLRDGRPVGLLSLYRTRVTPFTLRQIELMATFADQAVIAIENARLFEEVQARTSELAKTVEDLEIASQHKSQFVANMSHELRTPLAAILGYAELMQEGFYESQGPKSLDALTRIRSNGKHLLGLINTVLDIAKIESGQFTLNMAEYAIESVVETVRSATESLAHNKKVTLTTEVAKALPVGLGDEQRLTQVLLNLVGNAIKFTDAGEVRVSATTVNRHFAVSVADTGPGIPEEHQARIFEQFHQVDSSNTKAKGGTGLGLAIAKQIIEMHGGRIWVESTLGKGATFQMELPIRAEFSKGAS